MVRSGSTVRVRQRLCKSPGNRGFAVQVYLLVIARASGVEHVVEQSALQAAPSRDAEAAVSFCRTGSQAESIPTHGC